MLLLNELDIFTIVGYFIAVFGIGYYYSHQQEESSEQYFLAGRQMGWLVIGASLFATNISTEHFVGLSGYGATRGLAAGSIEWMAIIFLMVLGWLIAPVFINSKVFTVPEFFGLRFNNASRIYLATVSIVAYIFTKLSVTLFAAGLLLEQVLGWDIYFSAVLMIVITGLYTIIGGLSAVMYTSVLQAALMILGSLVLTVGGLIEVGGWSGLQAQLPADHFSIFKAASDPDFPWSGILFGAPILAIWYWCTDQYIVQRILAAKDIKAARSGTILAGFLKVLPVLLWVIPGLIAAALYPGISGNEAYTALLGNGLIPTGLQGLVIVGILSALMSSLAACFNSAATLFTMDYYRVWYPNTPDSKLVLIGKLFTTGMVLVCILWIPLTKFINSNMYVHLQTLQSYISPPIAAVFITGLLWRRANGRSAFGALITGGVLGLLRLFSDMGFLQDSLLMQLLHPMMSLNFLHFAAALFLVTIITMAALSYLFEQSGKQASGNLTLTRKNFSFFSAPTEVSPMGMIASSPQRMLSIILILLIIGLSGIFF
ncbi:MAG: sodium:solute symporter [Calditrichia bacterium]